MTFCFQNAERRTIIVNQLTGESPELNILTHDMKVFRILGIESRVDGDAYQLVFTCLVRPHTEKFKERKWYLLPCKHCSSDTIITETAELRTDYIPYTHGYLVIEYKK